MTGIPASRASSFRAAHMSRILYSLVHCKFVEFSSSRREAARHSSCEFRALISRAVYVEITQQTPSTHLLETQSRAGALHRLKMHMNEHTILNVARRRFRREPAAATSPYPCRSKAGARVGIALPTDRHRAAAEASLRRRSRRDNIRKVLDELKVESSERSIELTSVARAGLPREARLPEFLDRIASDKPPRYSRAVLETLAIVAYRQPVTRGDIEEIRGVAVSPPPLKALEERGWIEAVGHRETPGRPALFATTRKFLDDLNLRSLEELPPLDELQAALEPATATLVALEAASSPSEQESTGESQPPESTEQAHAG